MPIGVGLLTLIRPIWAGVVWIFRKAVVEPLELRIVSLERGQERQETLSREVLDSVERLHERMGCSEGNECHILRAHPRTRNDDSDKMERAA